MVVTVPPSIPQKFAAISLSAMTVQFSWSPPPTPSFVSNYTLTCASEVEVSTVTSIYTEAGSYIVGGLRPATEYSCRVFASNIIGDSPSASRILTTMDECMCVLPKGPIKFYQFIIISL